MLNSIKPKIELPNILTSLDWIIFGLILLITLCSVLYGQHLKKKTISSKDEQKSFLDLLLMGRKLTLPMFVATLVATWYGGIFGVTKIAFEKGIFNFITQGAFWYCAYLVFAFFIVSKVSRYNAITLPDLINKMFGPRSAKLSAIFNFFNVLPIVYVISVGLFLQLLFGGQLWVMMIIGTLIVIFYSLFGGFRAVVFSDLVQFFIMCFGVLFVLLISVFKFGGLQFLTDNLSSSHFSVTGGEGWGITIAWGLIAFSTLVDPNFYQRCFAAKSPQIAKKGILISTLIWFCFDICTTFGAMYAKAIIPNAESKHAYLIYAIQILPPGLRGFVLAGILATILSTLDSYLFIAGTTISFDLVPKRLQGKVLFHHMGIILVGIISICMAYLFKGNIKTVWKTLGSYSASCLLLPVVYGYIFPRKIKDKQFVCACILGVFATSYWRNATHVGFCQQIDEIYIGILATSLGLLLYPISSHKLSSLIRTAKQIFSNNI